MKRTDIGGGYACWLGYRYIEDDRLRETYAKRCSSFSVVGDSPLTASARSELNRALAAMLGVNPREDGEAPAILAGVFGSFDELGEEGYTIRAEADGRVVLSGATDKGTLYAVFHFIRLLQTGESLEELDVCEVPGNGIRMIDHWDNLDGSIERGYAGNSLFFREGHIVGDLSRIRDYARLLASGGINAIAINNVNVHSRESMLIAESFLPGVANIAGVFRDYGIRLYLSVNFASPIELGGLDTADPLDPGVIRWWKDAADLVYRFMPDFGGFLVKADSEFRPGPFTYGRNHADGANLMAEALAPYGGVVIWRCFVYNCQQDWRDRRTDRARAAYDHFMPLDGQFRDNVLLQIKNGPMDFQVREPVSPLIGGLKRTNRLMELQITQEYTGQQRHLCYLVPQWKEALDFDTYARGPGSTAAEAASGRLFGGSRGGLAAVANVGDDENWTGHPLAQSNLYGYARLAWNPKLTSEGIAREWIRMTFPWDADTERGVLEMLLSSHAIYEQYTAPLGVGWMVNPDHHYGPNVDGYEYAKWGTYHFADCHGIGVDRSVRTGTGYAGQYFRPWSDIYESLERCPDELLLFFHHVPYRHRLKSGKTVIQHIYDTRFRGAEQAEELVRLWDSLQGKVDDDVYRQVRERLVHQTEHSREWRDVLNAYFYRKSGIADEQGRKIY